MIEKTTKITSAGVYQGYDPGKVTDAWQYQRRNNPSLGKLTFVSIMFEKKFGYPPDSVMQVGTTIWAGPLRDSLPAQFQQLRLI